jgi:hypothetical protein
MKASHVCIIGCASLVLLFALVGCASSPPITSSSASLSFASPQELRASYGYNYLTNPYLEPVSLLRGKKNEFIVLKIDLELAVPARVKFYASALSPDGKEVAELKNIELFQLYWDMQAEGEGSGRRAPNLQRSYLPGFEFTARKGRNTYYAVLIGANPIPRPATVSAELNVVGLDSIVFEAELPPLAVK